MLALAERFAPAFGDAEIELLDVLVLAQRLGLAVEHHAAVFEHIAVTRVFQRHAGVLLREQERHRLLGVEIADDFENLLDQLRREPHRRFVQQDHLRPRHQRPSDRAHLLFTAGNVSGGGAAAPSRRVNAPVKRFSSTDRCAKQWRPSITWMQPRRTSSFGERACTSSPSKTTEPLVTSPRSADKRLEIALSVVHLPAPFAPNSATISPLATLSDTPLSTRMT